MVMTANVEMKMPFVKFWKFVRRSGFAATASLLACGMAATVLPSAAAAEQLVITIHSVKALDQIDVTPADFYVRAVIGGQIHLTERISQQNEIQPNWTIRETVGPGVVKVRLELWDKDLRIDDLIDINGRKDTSKRALDFSVNMRTCRVIGFKGSPRCGTRITRSGDEKKKAEITFSVAKK